MSVMGIDLGTTFSCVAIYQNGRAEILPNRLGNRITPSCVSFSDGRRLIGEAAASKAYSNHKNTIFDAKRLIGRDFNDPIVQNDMKNWPFKVVNVNGKPKFEVEHNRGELKRHSPEEISAEVLYEMKSIAEKFLGKPVRKAVVTVPAYFNNSQRQATKDACEIAELDVLKIINEPTAAAIAYGFNSQFENRRTILVYDLGGGTFDVTILEIDGGIFDVKSTGGDTHLGGQDFTLKLVDHFCEKIMKNYNYDIKKDLKALGQLRQECEKAKIYLSSMGETDIDIDNLYNGKGFHDKISRALFEGLNVIDFRRTLEVVNQALTDAKMKAEDIDEVVLVGGSSRIPKIRNLVQDLFGGKIHQNIHPDEAVAMGATIMAAKLAERPAELQEIVINDVTPLSLGVEVVGGLMSVITPRNTTIPTKISKGFTTHEDNQTSIKLSVYEGERPLIRDNEPLGNFILDGIPPQQRQTPSITVTFDINSDGILNVLAVDKSTGIEKSIKIEKGKEPLSSAEIKRLIGEAKVYLDDDKAEKERVEAKMKVEELCLEKKSEIMYGRTKNALSENVKEQIKSECNTMLKWLEQNEAATKEDYQVKLQQLTRTFQRLFK